jgi:hypothetical protein
VRRHRDHRERRHQGRRRDRHGHRRPAEPVGAASCRGWGEEACHPATAGGRLPVRCRHHAGRGPDDPQPDARHARHQERRHRDAEPPDGPAERRRRRRTGCCRPAAGADRAWVTWTSAAWAARPGRPAGRLPVPPEPAAAGQRPPASGPVPRVRPEPRVQRVLLTPLPAPEPWAVRPDPASPLRAWERTAPPARRPPGPRACWGAAPASGPPEREQPGSGSGTGVGTCAHRRTSTIRPWDRRPATGGPLGPPPWRTPTSRTRPVPSTWRERLCW